MSEKIKLPEKEVNINNATIHLFNVDTEELVKHDGTLEYVVTNPETGEVSIKAPYNVGLRIGLNINSNLFFEQPGVSFVEKPTAEDENGNTIEVIEEDSKK